MSGVRVGTREDELRRVRQRAEHRRQAAVRRCDGADASRLAALVVAIDVELGDALPSALPAAATGSARPTGLDAFTRARAAAHGVPVATMRAWARDNDVPVGTRGRVSFEVLDAWAEAHLEDYS